MQTNRYNRGFTAFFAVLVSSLALAVGLSIYDLLLRQITLSQTARDSQMAIFAADSGVECALYWDNKATDANFSSGSARGAVSIFGTSTTGQWGTTNVTCNTQNITTKGALSVDWTQYVNTTYGCPSTESANWCTVSSASAATTTFSMILNPSGATTLGATTTCATVTVAKWGNPAQTMITSHGFSNCTNNGAVRLERSLQVSY